MDDGNGCRRRSHARTLIKNLVRNLRALPEGERPVDPSRAAKTLNEILLLDAAIDEVDA